MRPCMTSCNQRPVRHELVSGTEAGRPDDAPGAVDTTGASRCSRCSVHNCIERRRSRGTYGAGGSAPVWPMPGCRVRGFPDADVAPLCDRGLHGQRRHHRSRPASSAVVRPVAAAGVAVAAVAVALVAVVVGVAIEQAAGPQNCHGIGWGCTPDPATSAFLAGMVVGAPTGVVGWAATWVGWAVTRTAPTRSTGRPGGGPRG